MLLTPRPTAIFAGNDEMAAGVLQTARQMNIRVPEDLSVVGFDDFEIARRLWPSLTTIRTPTREIGRLAVARLMGVEDETRDLKDRLPSLVVRGRIDLGQPVPEIVWILLPPMSWAVAALVFRRVRRGTQGYAERHLRSRLPTWVASFEGIALNVLWLAGSLGLPSSCSCGCTQRSIRTCWPRTYTRR